MTGCYYSRYLDPLDKLHSADEIPRAMMIKHNYRQLSNRICLGSGSVIVQISQFSQRMAEAQHGKCTSISSIPFYCRKYKMCLRLSFLGEDIGRGTHFSLFFVIMKGDFDNSLKWPFTSKVTFKLINQRGGRDIIDTFQPDPMSSSFQKPKLDMNTASGCPRFAYHTELINSGFIVENRVFISIDCH